MSIKSYLVDPSLYDLDKPIVGVDEVRKYIPQRHEMELLQSIVYDDYENKACVGCKDITDQEFWVRGHMPGFALMPGVLICEVAAQLATFFIAYHGLMTNSIIGLAGLQDVRFRGFVRPGDRLVMQAKLLHHRKILITANFQGLVNDNIVCEGIIKGVPLELDPS
ncbi:MAG: 3-hydroxyacyl-ACP dehydratase FabZ family protein [Thermoguttaceae bacterium]